MSQGPKLTRARRRALQRKNLPNARVLPDDLTFEQRELLLFLNNSHEQGNSALTTEQVAQGLGWTLHRAVDVLRQARALGMIAHDMDGPEATPNAQTVDVLQRFGLWDATPEERDALVLIEQGAARLPAPERAGFLIGCGLQELREQGHSVPEIRKLVLEYLDAGEQEMAEQDGPKGVPN